MKLFVVSFLIVIIPITQTSHPTDEDLRIPRIGFSYLGKSIFGNPSRESSIKVQAWTKESYENPEFLGTYAEGDILFPKIIGRYGVINETLRWPMGIVPYEISSNFGLLQRFAIWRAMITFEKEACVREKTRYDEDWIFINDLPAGCYSSVGRIGGKQDVNLEPPNCLRCGTIIHELMHVIGFAHEQSRHDRDKYVTVIYENIEQDEMYNFDKCKPTEYTTFNLSYDYVSLMHYSNYAFTSNSLETMVAKNKTIKLGLANYFSKKDIKKVNLMYKCCSTNLCCFKWHIHLSLVVIFFELLF